jgi:hypothetical protein
MMLTMLTVAVERMMADEGSFELEIAIRTTFFLAMNLTCPGCLVCFSGEDLDE